MNLSRMLFAIPLSLGLFACGPSYDRTEIDGVVVGKLSGRVSESEIVVASGGVVKAHIEPFDTENKDLTSHVRSLDPTILQVAPVVTDHDYAFFGVRPGRTVVEVKADDRVVLTIEAVVQAQPGPR